MQNYVSSLSERYPSNEMKYLFSPEKKFTTWRKLWIALAEAEKELGLDISDEQIKELQDYADDINYQVAKEREKIVRHDVMSHVYIISASYNVIGLLFRWTLSLPRIS